MANLSDSPQDRLWNEYSAVFREFDDLTLARWLAQTLGQLEGRCWRLSHPLLGAYRLAAQVAHGRQIWHKRFASPPASFREAPCCRAPLLPLLTRDVLETGLICQHCGDACMPFEEIAPDLQEAIRSWAERYSPVHNVAHWDDAQRKRGGNYDGRLEEAAEAAEKLLVEAGRFLAPRLLDSCAAAIWEDQDECLEVRPEDVDL
jgi:hypothetical protein